MASSSDVDAATAALIAQLMAEDLGESYYRHSAPIGASYHDYEEPLSSYERQKLDAENHPDEAGEEGSGWDPEDPDEVNRVATLDESPSPNGLADHGTWDSSYVDEHGVQQTAAPSLHSETSHCTSENNGNEDHCDTDSSDRESLVCSSPISQSPSNLSPDFPSKANNTSQHATDSTEIHPCLLSGPVQIPQDHIDDAASISTPLVSDSHPTAVDACEEPSTTQPPTTAQEVEDRWDDGLDYSSAKGKGKAVRAYDEFKLGLRNNHGDGWTKIDAGIENGDCDTEDEDEAEIDDEDLPFIRIPWPPAEKEEVLSQRENAEVAEIRVGDDETLESILRDINLREEKRREEKAVEETREAQMEDVLERKVVASW